MNRVVTGSSLPTTVDQLLTGTPPPLWKVAVEGFEPQVLQGVTQALHNPELKAVLLEADSPALQPLSAATQLGSGHNQLWIRDLSFVQQRCRTEPSYRVGSLPI